MFKLEMKIPGPISIKILSSLAGPCQMLLLMADDNAIFYVRTNVEVANDALQTFANQIQGIANAIFDSIFFITGQVLTAEIVSVTLPDPWLRPLGNHMSETVAHAAKEKGLGAKPGEYLFDAITDAPIRFALRDLRQATLLPDDTPFYVFRVLETIRDAITDESADNKVRGWNDMHNALHTSQAYFESITKASKSIRHGSPIPISGAERERQIGKAWIVIYRYWEYLKNNRQQLDISKFPSL